MVEVNRHPTNDQLRAFGRAMLLGFGILGLLLWYAGVKPEGRWLGWPAAGWGLRGDARHVTAIVLAGLGVSLFVLSTFAHRVARPVYVGWMTVAMHIGGVMTVVMLTLLFITVLPVFSLIRLADPLRLKWKASGTYWEPYRPHEATLDRMMRPF